jgi:hypothetical protein
MDGYQFLGQVDGAELVVRIAGEGQEILVEQGVSTRGDLLARLLAGDEPVREGRSGDGRRWAVVFHSKGVDEFLYRVIDRLIDIRVVHPTMVQLPLALTEEEAAELKAVLGGG